MTRELIHARLRAAALPLAHPPLDAPWNTQELADLLPRDTVLTDAAVLVPIVCRADHPTVILTRRGDQLRHHAGQISFPGGRVEADDAGPVEAALREAQEEIGLAAALVEPVGFLDRYATITGFSVTPVLALVDPAVQLLPDPGEVAEAFEVPLAFLLDPQHHELRSGEFRGKLRQYHVFEYGAHHIWGATAAMIVNLVERLRRVESA